MRTANVQEIFCSLQGEGRYSGEATIFVRFSGCNLRCSYCDTKRALRPAKYCHYEKIPFSGKSKRFRNDLSAKQIAQLIKDIKTRTRLISFTGGEPLLAAEIIAEIISLLGNSYTYLLETNGTLPEKLKYLKSKIDVYSIDLKKGSTEQNIKFCQALKNKDKYLKIVIQNDLSPQELLADIRRCNINEVYFQPESGKKIKQKIFIELLSNLENSNINYKFNIQLHKILKLK